MIVNPLLDKLDKKGVLGEILGTGQKQQQPTQKIESQPLSPQPQQEEGAVQSPQQPATQQQQKAITPEDAFMGILQGVIENAR